MSGAQRKKLAREEKKKHRGQNKGRRFQKIRDELDLCWKVAAGETCEFGSECVRPAPRRVFVYLAEHVPDAALHTMSMGTLTLNQGTLSSQPPPSFPTNLPL
jgi:hypothetical protein